MSSTAQLPPDTEKPPLGVVFTVFRDAQGLLLLIETPDALVQQVASRMRFGHAHLQAAARATSGQGPAATDSRDRAAKSAPKEPDLDYSPLLMRHGMLLVLGAGAPRPAKLDAFLQKAAPFT